MTAAKFTGILFSVLLAGGCAEYGSSPRSSTGATPTSPSTVAGPALREGSGTSAALASPMTATVQFGQPNVGSPFPPTSGHDQSAHAKDNLVPRTVVISKGGTVTFNTFGVHQVAIYAPGTEPGDIDTSDLVLTPMGCPKPGGAKLLINDSTNRVALYAQPCGPGARQVQHTFNNAGRYLVICAFLPHFEVQMYGWVEVRDE
jgi:plastocyanin